MKFKKGRSKCPLNYGLETFGDHWSLLIVRELILKGKRTYNELLYTNEGISTNILANRLLQLRKDGIVLVNRDPKHKQKKIFSLTQKGLDLLPIIIEIGLWSDKYGKNLWSASETLFGKKRSTVAIDRRRLYNRVAKEHQLQGG